mgnify:CR=1 FL=1
MSATPAAAEMCVLLQQRILLLAAAFAKGRAHLSPLRRVEARVIDCNRTWLRPFVHARHARSSRRTGRQNFDQGGTTRRPLTSLGDRLQYRHDLLQRRPLGRLRMQHAPTRGEPPQRIRMAAALNRQRRVLVERAIKLCDQHH